MAWGQQGVPAFGQRLSRYSVHKTGQADLLIHARAQTLTLRLVYVVLSCWIRRWTCMALGSECLKPRRIPVLATKSGSQMMRRIWQHE